MGQGHIERKVLKQQNARTNTPRYWGSRFLCCRRRYAAQSSSLPVRNTTPTINSYIELFLCQYKPGGGQYGFPAVTGIYSILRGFVPAICTSTSATAIHANTRSSILDRWRAQSCSSATYYASKHIYQLKTQIWMSLSIITWFYHATYQPTILRSLHRQKVDLNEPMS